VGRTLDELEEPGGDQQAQWDTDDPDQPPTLISEREGECGQDRGVHEVQTEGHLPEPEDRRRLEEPTGEGASDGDDDEAGRAHTRQAPERLTERR